jgi:hypothetical protein
MRKSDDPGSGRRTERKKQEEKKKWRHGWSHAASNRRGLHLALVSSSSVVLLRGHLAATDELAGAGELMITHGPAARTRRT